MIRMWSKLVVKAIYSCHQDTILVELSLCLSAFVANLNCFQQFPVWFIGYLVKTKFLLTQS
jgi:hypothetical protein